MDQAAVRHNDQSDSYGNEDRNRNGDFGQNPQIIQQSHRLSMTRPHRREKRTPPDAQKPGLGKIRDRGEEYIKRQNYSLPNRFST
jgi:hypothetical protein